MSHKADKTVMFADVLKITDEKEKVAIHNEKWTRKNQNIIDEIDMDNEA